MATIVVSIICIAMVLLGAMTLSQGLLTSADTAASSVQELSVREGEMSRTRLTSESAVLLSHDTVQLRLDNSGQTRLASYDKWDFIIQYYDYSDNYYVKWLPYDGGVLGENAWQNTGLYFSGQPEVFEPGILNPQEEIALEARLNPPAGYRAISITVATSNGVAPTTVLGPPTLTSHTETVTLGGDDYYLLKGWTSADGTAITATTPTIPNNETGRWLLYNSANSSLYARHVFPLSHINEISPAMWTVNYYGIADGWIGQRFLDAHFNIDIIVKRADGSVRETIASGVATATFSDGNTWIELSGTYNFPGYTVADETDYLEIDFYGESTGQGPNSPAAIRLRIDDGTLPESSQTRITGMEWS